MPINGNLLLECENFRICVAAVYLEVIGMN